MKGESNMDIGYMVCSEIENLALRCLELKKWKFKKSNYQSELSNGMVPFVVFESSICKFKISFNEWSPPYQTQIYSIDVYYGKLDAQDYINIMGVGENACYCWHSVPRILHFLDGKDAGYAAKNLFSHDRIKEYGKNVSSESLEGKLVEWEIRKHAYIWDKYASGLFELFDLKNGVLWDKYRSFLKEVYDIKGRNPNLTPSLDKVC